MKVSIFLTSFGGRIAFASKSRTSPAMRVVNAVGSKCVIGPMPQRPAWMLSHALARELPMGETMPIPVTTTRRWLIFETPLSDGDARRDPRMRRSIAPAPETRGAAQARPRRRHASGGQALTWALM